MITQNISCELILIYTIYKKFIKAFSTYPSDVETLNFVCYFSTLTLDNKPKTFRKGMFNPILRSSDKNMIQEEYEEKS